MAAEEELPEKLDKLEITPIIPQVKLLDSNLPVQFNPFFENDLKDTDVDVKSEHDAGTTSAASPILTGISRPVNNCRRCRYRRASESVLDELKYASASTGTSDTLEYSRTPPNGGLKQTLKKSTASSVSGPGNRKVLLREPVLRALQTCLHPHNARRNLHSSAVPNVAATGHNDSPLVTKGMSDFRDLIDECRNLLSEEVDFTGRLNQMSLSSRNSKNFTTMQTPKTGNSNKLSKNRKPISNESSTPSSLSSSSKSFEEQQRQNLLNGTSFIQPPLLGNSISSTSNLQQRNGNTVSPEHARCSTTCSQQAGNSVSAATACDDVTIDELASYFDTFVHIPKKMSSMAEMMYI